MSLNVKVCDVGLKCSDLIEINKYILLHV